MMQLWARVEGAMLLALALVLAVAMLHAADAGWMVTPRSSVSLAAGPVSNIRELSGVRNLGPQAGGLERFVAIQDENRQIVVLDESLSGRKRRTSTSAARGDLWGKNLLKSDIFD
jgi:hypothetical protein